jgi:hypothetical protein
MMVGSYLISLHKSQSSVKPCHIKGLKPPRWLIDHDGSVLKGVRWMNCIWMAAGPPAVILLSGTETRTGTETGTR